MPCCGNILYFFEKDIQYSVALHDRVSACMYYSNKCMCIDIFFLTFFRLRKHLEKEQHAKMHIAFLFVLH